MTSTKCKSKVCRQYSQLTKRHMLEWWRARWGLYYMLLIPFLLVVVSFGPYRLQTSEPVSYSLDRLMHPIYPVAKLDQRSNSWRWGQTDST